MYVDQVPSERNKIKLLTINIEATSKLNNIEETLITKSNVLQYLQEIIKRKEDEIINIRNNRSESIKQFDCICDSKESEGREIKNDRNMTIKVQKINCNLKIIRL